MSREGLPQRPGAGFRVDTDAGARRRAEDATVKEMYDAWLADGVARKDGNAEIRRSFEEDVLPVLDSHPVREVTEHELRSLLRGVVSRGVNRMAVNLSRDLKQMFDWAEKRQPWRRLLHEGDPTDLIESSASSQPTTTCRTSARVC